MEYTLDQIDVLSLAKVAGVIGLLWGVIIAISWVGAAALGGPFPGAGELAISVFGSVLSGAIAGGITAILYNVAASLLGGLKLELND